RYRAGLVVHAHLRLLKALPDADRDERQEHGVNDSDHGENEAGPVVVSGPHLAGRKFLHEVADREGREDDAADHDDTGRRGWKGFQPRNHRVTAAAATTPRRTSSTVPAPRARPRSRVG